MSRKVLTPEQEAEIVSAYLSGENGRKIAIRYGISPTPVYAAIQRAEAAPPAPVRRDFGWTPEHLAQMISMYADGVPQQQIADHFGVSRSFIGRRVRALGLVATPRPKGSRSPIWKGGRKKSADGYWMVAVPDEDRQYCLPNSSGYAFEHRLIVGRAMGRRLTRAETVHHINGDRSDNRLENLQLRKGHHGQGAAFRCRSCGSHDIEAVPLS